MMFGFGLERLGLLSARFPGRTLILVAVLLAVAVAGLTRLGFNSDIREVFRSDSESFSVLEEMTETYDASEHDLFVVVQSDDLFQADRLTALWDFFLDIRLMPGIKSALSMFSARTPPAADGTTEDIFPVFLDETVDLEALRATVSAHPLVHNKMLSEDGNVAVIVVSIDPEASELTDVRGVIEDIRASADTLLTDGGMQVGITGMPAIRSTLVQILTRDQLVFKVAAFTISILLSWLYFRNFRYLLLAVLPPAVAGVLLLGGMGWFGQQITIVTNVVPNLVMVITFSNAIHILLAVRRQRARGQERATSIMEAVRTVGPATVMTAATTAVALSALVLVARPAITRFGLTAASGTALACLVALVLIPALARYLIRDSDDDASTREKHKILDLAAGVDATAAWASRIVLRHSVALATVGMLVFVVCGTLYFLNQPQFRYGANLPVGTEVQRTAELIDKRLAGWNTMRLYIKLPDGAEALSPETADLVGQAHAILQSEPQLREVWSLHSVMQWLRDDGMSDGKILDYIGNSPSPLYQRLVSRDTNSSLIYAHMADLEAHELLAMEARLQDKLDVLRQSYPGADLHLTGISLQSARAAYEMIALLNRSLLIAICVIIVLIGLSLRSPTASLLATFPNLFPIAVGGAYLYLSGRELEFTSIIIFTIGFGISVDSTIHVLNHYRRYLAMEPSWDAALARTVSKIGPALIVSTLALMAGGVTILSPLPMAQLYGRLVMIVLGAALVGDLLLLPALIALVERWRRRGEVAREAAAE
jgi:predicted RND superfamily exporter protein